MASQFVYLRSDQLNELEEDIDALAAALARQDMEILDRHPDGRGLLVLASNKTYGLGPRRMSRASKFVLCLLPEGEPCSRWPTPLPRETVLRLLDVLEAAIAEISALTSHDLIEISEALNIAREAPATGPRPIQRLAAFTARQRRLTGTGRRLVDEFGLELDLLDSKIASYRDLGGDHEGVIARLSCHAELGSRLRVTAGEDSAGPKARLTTPSRHGEIRESIDSATALGNAVIQLWNAMILMEQPVVPSGAVTTSSRSIGWAMASRGSGRKPGSSARENATHQQSSIRSGVPWRLGS